MKTLVLSMISIAATVAAMTACTSESDGIDEVTKEAKVEIKANAGVGSIITKAPVSEFGNDGLNLFFCKVDNKIAVSDWSTAEALYAKADKDGNISFYGEASRSNIQKQYYNADASIFSWMSGCYLGNATIDSGDNLTNNTVSFTITGQEDIMATDSLAGSKTAALKQYTFNHLLSNLEFTIATPQNASAGDITAIKNTFGKVTSIKVLDQPNNLTLTLEGKPSLAIKQANSKSDFSSIASAMDITNSQIFDHIMIFPSNELGKAATPINIKVFTENATEGIDVSVTIGDGTASVAAQTKYIVTLTFSGSDISATAKIGEWKEGTGSGEVK